jgi:CarD family transcriptional regulator
MATAKSAASGKTAKKPSAKSSKTTTAKSAVKSAAKAKPTSAKKAKPAAKKPAAAKKAAKPAKKPAAKAAAAKSATAKSAAPKSAAKAKPAAKKPAAKPKAEDLHGFAVKDYVVYPSHGVGQITAVEEHEIGDITLSVFVVVFDKEKMTLRVPLNKAATSGMRRLSSAQKMEQAITTLKGRARTRRVMWSRRAQEYDAKLNSGDPVSIAEVVRDLHRDEGQPDQSYSERQMYEAALERLAREFAAVENTDTEQAAEKLENVLRAA